MNDIGGYITWMVQWSGKQQEQGLVGPESGKYPSGTKCHTSRTLFFFSFSFLWRKQGTFDEKVMN
jgi:hypothetical protein